MTAGDPEFRFSTAECARRLGVPSKVLVPLVGSDHRWAPLLGVRQGDLGTGQRREWTARQLVVMAYLLDVHNGAGPWWQRDRFVEMIRSAPWGEAPLWVADRRFQACYYPRWDLASWPTPDRASVVLEGAH